MVGKKLNFWLQFAEEMLIKSCASFASVGSIRDSSGIRGALSQNDECKCEAFGSQETDTVSRRVILMAQ